MVLHKKGTQTNAHPHLYHQLKILKHYLITEGFFSILCKIYMINTIRIIMVSYYPLIRKGIA